MVEDVLTIRYQRVIFTVNVRGCLDYKFTVNGRGCLDYKFTVNGRGCLDYKISDGYIYGQW